MKGVSVISSAVGRSLYCEYIWPNTMKSTRPFYMAAPEAKVTELEARLAILEAAIRTGNVSTAPCTDVVDVPFLAKLSGEDQMAAKTMVQENAALKAKVAALSDTLEQRDYQIEHLRRHFQLPK